MIEKTRTFADASGVDAAKVQIKDAATGVWFEKMAPSTFFPFGTSAAQVHNMVASAFQNLHHLAEARVGDAQTWRGSPTTG